MAPTDIDALAAAVAPLDADAGAAAAARHATLVKPRGSLGRLEDLGVRLAGIAGRSPAPVPTTPSVIIAVADHGVHARLIDPWPQRVTTRMATMFAEGRAAINALARTVGASVAVLDVGCTEPPPPHLRIHRARIRAGTADMTVEPAMSPRQAADAIDAGAALARDLVAGGADLLVTGDMGIANTTASACLVAAFTGAEPAAVTGVGAGATNAALAHKVKVVRQILARHRPDPGDAVGVLAAVGGLEHAALVGVMLSGAAARVPVVLDGVITNAAALAADALRPPVTGYLIASHRSAEPGADVALDHLGLEPLFDLGLRLGEGTGGALAVPLVQAAARALDQMATLDDLGV